MDILANLLMTLFAIVALGLGMFLVCLILSWHESIRRYDYNPDGSVSYTGQQTARTIAY